MSEENPFRRKSSRIVYDNPWIRVREDEVVRPDGRGGIYGVVEFKNVAVGVVPLTEDGHTFLVGQYRYPLDEYSWEIPEGGGSPSEDPEKSARRELKEEAGITARRWTYLGRAHLSNSATDEVAHLYLAEELEFGEAEPEGTEVLRLKKVPFEQAWEMAMNGEITDAMAIATLARAKRVLETRSRR